MLQQLQSIFTKFTSKIVLGLGIASLILLIGFANAKDRLKVPLDELSIELSPYAQEAIKNGVLLTIDCEFALIKSVFLFDLASNEKNHRFTLSRHTLSNRYIVKRDNLSTPHMFRSIPEATNYITAQSLILLESYTTYDSQRRMRISLNKFELPGPMRLQAFLQDKWDMDTGWLAWEYEN